MAQRAQFRGLLALISSTSANARNEFMDRDTNAAINIRRCLVLKTRPKELTRSKILGAASQARSMPV